nr:Uncharacterized protein family (UPF0149) [uncultured bacterium]
MKQTSLPTYIELSQALNDTTLKLHASQAHGLVCGIIVGNTEHDIDTSAWQDLVTGGEKSGKTHSLLQSLYDESAKQINDYLFQFQLLLPEDEELSTRTEALSLWCQGFLVGLKVSNVQIADREPGDATEAINDLIEIARIDHEEIVDNEEDEAAYIEFVEYVRMAVILIYQELREPTTNDNAKQA